MSVIFNNFNDFFSMWDSNVASVWIPRDHRNFQFVIYAQGVVDAIQTLSVAVYAALMKIYIYQEFGLPVQPAGTSLF